MKKTQQLLEWLLGERKEFPFMKDMPEVAYPIGYNPKTGEMTSQLEPADREETEIGGHVEELERYETRHNANEPEND